MLVLAELIVYSTRWFACTLAKLVQFCALCLKPWHLKHCWIEGVILNSSTLKIMSVFWHISPPEISASACFGLSHFTLWKVGLYLFFFLHSFCLGMGYFIEIKQLFKIFQWYVVRYSLENQNLILSCVCRVVWLWKWHFNFFPKNLLHFWLTLQDGKVFGSISYLLWKSSCWSLVRYWELFYVDSETMGYRNVHCLSLTGCYRLQVHCGSRWLEKFGALFWEGFFGTIFHVSNERSKSTLIVRHFLLILTNTGFIWQWILTIWTKFDGGYFSRFYQSLIKGCTNQCIDWKSKLDLFS